MRQIERIQSLQVTALSRKTGQNTHTWREGQPKGGIAEPREEARFTRGTTELANTDLD